MSTRKKSPKGYLTGRNAGLGNSLVYKRSMRIDGHNTSVSLERPFWDAFKEIAIAKNVTLTALILEIESNRKHANLSSIIRLFVLDYYREPAERDHGKAQSI